MALLENQISAYAIGANDEPDEALVAYIKSLIVWAIRNATGVKRCAYTNDEIHPASGARHKFTATWGANSSRTVWFHTLESALMIVGQHDIAAAADPDDIREIPLCVAMFVVTGE